MRSESMHFMRTKKQATPMRFLPAGLLLLALLSIFAAFSNAIAEGTEDSTHPAVIRPGVISGSGNHPTDFFLDLLVPVKDYGQRLVFFNANLRFDDAHQNEQNLGLGYRYLFEGKDTIAGIDGLVGMNIFLDSIETEHNNRFNQIGVGVEFLSPWLDLRANFYHPMSNRKQVPELSRYGFGQTSIVIYQGIEQPLWGYDAEIGTMLPVISDMVETRIYAGRYWYDAGHFTSDVSGWRYRVEFWPSRIINLQIEHKNDDRTDDVTSLGGYLNLPFSLENLLSGRNPFERFSEYAQFGHLPRSLTERMTERIVRDRNIITGAGPSESPEPVPGASLIYVNADNPTAGDGSFNNPYRDIADLALNDRYLDNATVYVFSSDNTPDLYNNVSIHLRDGMILWGEGARHPLYGLGGGKDAPILDGADGAAVVLANNNEVMGLTITTGEYGIYGENIMGAKIHDNTISNNQSNSIFITNSLAYGDMAGKSLSFSFANNQIIDNGDSGIHLVNDIYSVGDQEELSGVTVQASFNGNTITGNTGAGIDMQTEIRTAGLASPLSDSAIITSFENNVITVNQGARGGIYSLTDIYTFGEESLIAHPGISTTLTNNITNSNSGPGITLDSSIDTLNSNSSILGAANTGTIVNTITGNTVTHNGDEGLSITSQIYTEGESGSGIRDVAILNTVTDTAEGFSSNAGYGLGSFSAIYGRGEESLIVNASIANLFQDITVSGNDSQGMYIDNQIFTGWGEFWTAPNSPITDSSITNEINNNAMEENGDEETGGMQLYNSIATADENSPISGTTIATTVSGNGINRNNGFGLDLYSDTSTAGENSDISGSTISHTVSNTTFTDNSGWAINKIFSDFTAYELGSDLIGTSIANTVSNNTATGNYGGISLSANLSPYGDGSVISGSSVYDTITDNVLTAHTLDGLSLEYSVYADGGTEDSTVKVMLQDNTVTNNGASGVDIFSDVPIGIFTGDLGGGILGSTGNNAIHGNADFDLVNNTDEEVMASGNWWGTDEDPADRIDDVGDSSTVVAPWRSSAP